MKNYITVNLLRSRNFGVDIRGEITLNINNILAILIDKQPVKEHSTMGITYFLDESGTEISEQEAIANSQRNAKLLLNNPIGGYADRAIKGSYPYIVVEENRDTVLQLIKNAQ